MEKEHIDWMKEIENFGSVECTDGRWVLTWDWCEEGYDGEFHLDDPQDKPLLRADLSYRGRLEFELEDNSYCTLTPINTTREELERISRDLFNELPKDPESPREHKRIMEQWTWRTEPRGDTDDKEEKAKK